MKKPTKDHFVPQFYLQQFCCDNNENEVPCFSDAGPFLVLKNQSISSIGYEYDIYTFSNERIHISVDQYNNPEFETPFTQTDAWKHISTGQLGSLSECHMLHLYLLVRHLLSRSPEKLKIMEACCADAMSESPEQEYTPEEIDMYTHMSDLPGGVTQYFLENINDIDVFMSEYHNASIAVYESPIPLRTSMYPVVATSADQDSHRSYWLPISRYHGVLLLISNGLSEFGGVRQLSLDCARNYNRLFMTQLWRSVRARHVICNDEYIQEDIAWAGMSPEPGNPKRFRRPEVEAV